MSQATKNKLLKALERLLNDEPENRELRIKARAGKLKINNSNVEKEAGLSVGALRRHEDIQILVTNKSLEARTTQSSSSTSPIELLQVEVKKLKSEMTRANKKKKEYLDLSRNHEEALARQAAIHIKIVQDFMGMLHESEREKAMDMVVKARPDNLIKGKFR
ncbi:bacterioferritin comigratory protein [Shewanella psychromarinicola]|uniref:Bacterioferritin comigratory protein n=1 Tax=Shewanella psychromarinicola TaxID=2487742 RepID=A0A3N4EBI4_9GAMM|nr:bacterioferritin comigratory protein [Shewanella psychromarinicola]AZG36414.1 bacterioferritin comigratory protein [Shewanella psychromarinicola]MCL1084427.1 hypothetical protein [Shewanella psychromarinicola]RPA34257.1 bacterioferritin comigratory protein [Shewanella psychromarinicola]